MRVTPKNLLNLAPNLEDDYVSVSDPKDWEAFMRFIYWCYSLKLDGHTPESLTEAAIIQYSTWRKLTNPDFLKLYQDPHFLDKKWYHPSKTPKGSLGPESALSCFMGHQLPKPKTYIPQVLAALNQGMGAVVIGTLRTLA